jgi:hypothetical protein
MDDNNNVDTNVTVTNADTDNDVVTYVAANITSGPFY